MSDENTAVDGALAAPVEAAPAPAEETPQTPAAATDVVDPTPARDEKGRFVPQERVNEITRARREAERERDRYRQEAEQLRQQLSQPVQRPVSAEAPPKLSDYGYDEAAHAAAMEKYIDQRLERRHQAVTEQSTRESLARSFESKAVEYARTVPDFDDRVSDLTRAVQFNPATVEVILTSEHGPALTYHLATHLDVADRIARMPPHFAAAELARIEARLTAPKPKATTNAPQPVPVLSGSSSPQKDPGKMSYEEYKKYRMGG